MDAESVQPILDELFSSLEPLDAQSSAVLQFLKSKGLATDEELAPFLKQAADAASVHWLAVRIRAAAMIANLMNPPEEESFNTHVEKNMGSASKEDRQEPRQENRHEVEDKKTPHNEDNEIPDDEKDEKDDPEPRLTAGKAGHVADERKAPANDDAENAA